jgi:hypothetical protein
LTHEATLRERRKWLLVVSEVVTHGLVISTVLKVMTVLTVLIHVVGAVVRGMRVVVVHRDGRGSVDDGHLLARSTRMTTQLIKATTTARCAIANSDQNNSEKKVAADLSATTDEGREDSEYSVGREGENGE